MKFKGMDFEIGISIDLDFEVECSYGFSRKTRFF
jgi:hypothetical protein